MNILKKVLALIVHRKRIMSHIIKINNLKAQMTADVKAYKEKISTEWESAMETIDKINKESE